MSDKMKLMRASVQFDYFSENFDRFRADFYKYSNMATPLPFITDNILHFMSESQISYFKLPAKLAQDNHNHYYFFKVKMQKDNQQVRTYEYINSSYDLS